MGVIITGKGTLVKAEPFACVLVSMAIRREPEQLPGGVDKAFVRNYCVTSILSHPEANSKLH